MKEFQFRKISIWFFSQVAMASTFRKQFGQGSLDKRDKKESCWLRNQIIQGTLHIYDTKRKERKPAWLQEDNRIREKLFCFVLVDKRYKYAYRQKKRKQDRKRKLENLAWIPEGLQPALIFNCVQVDVRAHSERMHSSSLMLQSVVWLEIGLSWPV